MTALQEYLILFYRFKLKYFHSPHFYTLILTQLNELKEFFHLLLLINNSRRFGEFN